MCFRNLRIFSASLFLLVNFRSLRQVPQSCSKFYNGIKSRLVTFSSSKTTHTADSIMQVATPI
jgi:hypothetical protein